MTHEEFISTIAKSEPEEWTYDDDLQLYIFRGNVSISIVSDKDDNDREFHAEWVHNFSNESAKRARFFLRYNGSTVKTFYTAAVDGYRALIPYPNSDMCITDIQYRIGRIVNIPFNAVIDNYDDYLNQAGVIREDNS